jgi:hypothetical protein
MFNVESDSGIASARINGKYIDAGKAGEIAGLEFSVDSMRMSDAPREQRHANAVVTLDCTPATLLQVAMVILDKLDLPAFNSREWRLISTTLLNEGHSKPDTDEGKELIAMAEQIEASAANIANL